MCVSDILNDYSELQLGRPLNNFEAGHDNSGLFTEGQAGEASGREN